jgi:hypothetical protein
MEEVNKFYEWLLKMGNIHLADNDKMSKAYAIVYKNNVEPIKTKRYGKCS